MNRRHITIGSSLIAALLLAAVTRADAPATGPTDQSEVAALQQRAAALTKRNAALESQVIHLQNQVANLQMQLAKATGEPRFNFQVPQNGITRGIPQDAMPHLFNGGIYYTIPVNAQPR